MTDAAQVRRFIKQRRAAQSAAHLQSRSREICRRLLSLPQYAGAQDIFVYLPMPGEVCTHAFIAAAEAQGKRLSYPVCLRPGEMVAGRAHPKDMERNRYGGMQPMAGRYVAIDPQALQLAIVPGLAFDPACNRMGHGAGYYDRFLCRAGAGLVKIGVCFAFQMVQALHAQPWDVPMDLVVTEKRLYSRE